MEKFVLFAIFICYNYATMPSLVHGASISLCSKTPYPKLCNSLTSTKLDANNLDETISTLRDTSLRVTLAQAQQAHKLISNMDLSSFNELGKSAWSDCVQLYGDTINLLNRSIGFGKPPSSNDAHTWLSAACANKQTCQNGFIDFNLPSHLQAFRAILSDFSKYLSNSLAIHKATVSFSTLSSVEQAGKGRRRRLLSDGFPEWVSAADRRLLQSSSSPMKADVVVAQDGSGNYKTINEALAAISSGGNRLVIYVKKGVYKENVEIKNSMKNLMFVGDGIDATIVTGNKNAQGGSTTFGSATFGVSGDGFVARSMTFENTAGPQGRQAVALRSSSDHSVFYSCSFKGYQDTLYVLSKRQFYRNCDIYGTIDFIFGDAVAVLQNCNIYVRKPMSSQKNTMITAQARTDPNENTGFVIHNSRVTAASDLRAVQGSYRSYLGRPWQKYSRTIYMKSNLDSLIHPEGWLPWSGNFALSTLYYAEYMNTGGGAGTSGRVKWPGYHVITAAAEAEKFSVGNFLAGDSWIPGTGVPFTSGL